MCYSDKSETNVRLEMEKEIEGATSIFIRTGSFIMKTAVTLTLFCILLANTVNAKTDDSYVISRFKDRTGKEVVKIIVPGSPPPRIRPPSVVLPKNNRGDGIYSLTGVPAFNWTYGCSATSAGMMMGYYDRNGYPLMYVGPTDSGVCPLTNEAWGSSGTGEGSNGECPFVASHKGIDGRTTYGHVDDYWYKYGSFQDPYYGNWTPHNTVGTGDCLADFMGTNQFYPNDLHNADGSTSFAFYGNGDPYIPDTFGDGAYGIKLYAESLGYTVTAVFNQYIYEYAGTGKGFTFSDYKTEIDAGRPVIIQLKGHSVLGFGYNESASTNIIYIHDTWDYNDHEMEWADSYSTMRHYGVTVFRLTSSSSSSITVTSPNGGETWAPGVTYTISWTSNNVSGKINIYLYKEGSFDSTIAENISNSGSYSWTIPLAQEISDSYKVRIVSADNIAVYDDSDANFSVSNSGASLALQKLYLNLFYSNIAVDALKDSAMSSSSSARDRISLKKGAWPDGEIPDSIIVNIGGWTHTCTDFLVKGSKYISKTTDGSTKYIFSINTKKNLWDYTVSKASVFSDTDFSDSKLTVSIQINNGTVYSTTYSVKQLTQWKFSDTKNTSETLSTITNNMTSFGVNKAVGKFCSYATNKDYFKITKGEIELDDEIDPTLDTARIYIDNLSLGPFILTQKNAAKKIYTYKSERGTTPVVSLKIDLEKNIWAFSMTKGDCSDIEGPDIDVILKIGSAVGGVKLKTSQITKLSWKQE